MWRAISVEFRNEVDPGMRLILESNPATNLDEIRWDWTLQFFFVKFVVFFNPISDNLNLRSSFRVRRLNTWRNETRGAVGTLPPVGMSGLG